MYSDLAFLKSLKVAREEAGFTQKEVESQLSMRPLLIRDYEVGRLKIPLSVAMQLADFYSVSLDQLVGQESEKTILETSRTLSNFSAIFSGTSYQVMFLDSVLRAYFEDHRDKFFDRSLFDVLTMNLKVSEKKQLVIEIGKLLFSLAGCDGKISDQEVKTIRHILSLFSSIRSYKEISPYATKEISYSQVPKLYSEIEMRHFIIWMLFLFSKADGKISLEELKFIEKRAEELKVNKSNYLFIHDHFIQGEY